MKCFVTGGAGFIGSHLVDRLLKDGHEVVVFDRCERGDHFINRHDSSPRFTLYQGSITDSVWGMEGSDVVFHLAAKADVRFSGSSPSEVFRQNVHGTVNVLEAARANKVKQFVFASTGSIYGEPKIFPTPEDAPFPTQNSIYGASKLAGEGLVQAFSNNFGIQAFIFRFVSNVGERYTHGHIFDFYKKLKANPHELDVLGDGQQKKSYVYVGDTIDGIMTALDKADKKLNIFNLGTSSWCTVNDSIGWITAHLGVQPKLKYSGGERGWSGDSPFIYLDCTKLRKLGWEPKLTIQQGIIKTVEYMQSNPWLLTRGEQ